MVKAIVGANWGDEGKGKITDVLANDSDIVIRFQGGANAGHTIVNDYGKFALHQLPSGVFIRISPILSATVLLSALKTSLRKWLTSKTAEFPSQTLLFLTEHKLLCLTM